MIFAKFLKKLVKKILATGEPNFFYTKDWLNGKGFEIGDFTYGNPKILHWGESATLKIGKFCSIADEVTIFLGGNHRIDWISTYPFNFLKKEFPKAQDIAGHPATKGDVIIGNDVWIGFGATIMSGITIGDGAVIAAKSVVTKNVKPYEIVGGNPAKQISYRFDNDKIRVLLEIQWWNWDLNFINDNVKALCDGDIQKIEFKRNG